MNKKDDYLYQLEELNEANSTFDIDTKVLAEFDREINRSMRKHKIKNKDCEE